LEYIRNSGLKLFGNDIQQLVPGLRPAIQFIFEKHTQIFRLDQNHGKEI